MIELVIIIFAVLSDQLTKYLAKVFIAGNTVNVIPGIISFHYTENTGMAFSLLSESTALLAVISVVMSIVLIFLIYRYRKTYGRLYSVSLSFIAGGAIGNAIDRIISGYVIDFIDPVFVDFAVFNVADSFVTVGAVLLLIYLFFFSDNEKHTNSQ